ncbi:hypothetical protein [Senegalimassilia anaerobia]
MPKPITESPAINSTAFPVVKLANANIKNPPAVMAGLLMSTGFGPNLSMSLPPSGGPNMHTTPTGRIYRPPDPTGALVMNSATSGISVMVMVTQPTKSPPP